jgi:transcription elongation factor Elf1
MSVEDMMRLQKELEKYVEPTWKCPICKKKYYVIKPHYVKVEPSVPQCEDCGVGLEICE